MSENKCLRCGDDENRIDGYCSIYCRDMAEAEAEIAALREENELMREALSLIQGLTFDRDCCATAESLGELVDEVYRITTSHAHDAGKEPE